MSRKMRVKKGKRPGRLNLWFRPLTERVKQSARYGILFILKSTWNDLFKNIERAGFKKHAKSRGFCVWCIQPITHQDAAWQICDDCPIFDQGSFIHGKCLVSDTPCGDCIAYKWFDQNRRVQ